MKYKKQQWDKRDNILESLNKKDFKKIKIDMTIKSILKLYKNKYLLLQDWTNVWSNDRKKYIRLGVISAIRGDNNNNEIEIYFKNNKKIVTINLDEIIWTWYSRTEEKGYSLIRLSLEEFYDRINISENPKELMLLDEIER